MRRSSWLTPPAPTAAIELAARRVSVVALASAGGARLDAQASETLDEGIIAPGLSAPNILQPKAAADALGRVLERAGLAGIRRAALVVPDAVARLSLLPFETVPARPADLDELIRWQLRKSMPFPLEEAQVSHVVASRDAGTTVFAAVVARRDVIAEYEQVAMERGIHAGLVDLASLNVVNALVGTGTAPAGDWLLVHRTADGTTLAVLRADNLLFYRHRGVVEEEPLGVLVHQTAMYHEDRLGGGGFTEVRLSGDREGAAQARAEIADRLQVPVRAADLHTALELAGRAGTASDEAVDELDVLAPPVGVLLRGTAA